LNKAFALLLVYFVLFSSFFALIPPLKGAPPPKSICSDDVQISNSYLTLGVYDKTGNMNLNSSAGVCLLYPGDTSNIAFSVDGVSKNSGTSQGLGTYMTQTPVQVGLDSVKVSWEISKVHLTITYILQNDNIEVKAIINNNDVVSHQAGVRFLLDTQLGPNDGAPLYAPNVGVSTFERDLSNPTFNSIMAYDLYPNPTLQTYCTFLSEPNRVAFTWWPNSKDSNWDYSCDPSQRFFTPGSTKSPDSDSALILYYDPVNIQPGTSENLVFSYGLSLNDQSWKYSILSALDAYSSRLENILDSAINSYANMIIKFNEIGVDNHIAIFQNSGGSSDWRDNLGSFNQLLSVGDLVKTYGYLSVLKNINPKDIEAVPRQLMSALGSSDAAKWGWVTRDLKFSGFGIILSALSVAEMYYGHFAYTDAFDKLTSFNAVLSDIYKSVMNNPSDLDRIKTTLYSSFGTSLKTEIKNSHDALSQSVSSATLTSNIDSSYLLRIVKGVNNELDDVASFNRAIVLLGDQQYLLPSIESYKLAVDSTAESIEGLSNIGLAVDALGSATTLYGLMFAPTGAAGATCFLLGLALQLASFIIQTYNLSQEQGIIASMFSGTEALFQLAYSLPLMASKMQSIATTALNPSVIPENGQIVNVDLKNNLLSTSFDVTLNNLGPASNGHLLYNVYSLDHGLDLANMDMIDVNIPSQGTLVQSIDSPVVFSFLGGIYEARFEFWLGQVEVDSETIYYSVDPGGGTKIVNIMRNDINIGDTQSAQYDSSSYSADSLVSLDYSGSEINLHAYDVAGHHLGINYSTGLIDNEIPNANYSGIIPTREWMTLPPGVYTIKVVCIDAEQKEKFTVQAITLPNEPGRLDVFPHTLNYTVSAGAVSQVNLIVSQVGKQTGLSQISVTSVDLSSTSGDKIPAVLSLASFDINPNEKKMVSINYSVPNTLPIAKYAGNVTVIAKDSLGTIYNQIIPVDLNVASYVGGYGIGLFSLPNDSGTISVNNITYQPPANCSYAGNTTISAQPSHGFIFDHWLVRGNITLINPNAQTTKAIFDSPGSLTAVFTSTSGTFVVDMILWIVFLSLIVSASLTGTLFLRTRRRLNKFGKPKATQTFSQVSQKICSSCGSPNRDKAKFCKKCGNRL
jgi:hypothetical protein